LPSDSAADSRSDLLLAARGGGIKMFGAILRVLSGLGVSILITRLTGATSFGHYYMGLTFAQMLSQVAGLGLQSGILRFIPIARQQKDPAWLVGILRAGISIPTGTGLLLAVPMYLSADLVAQQFFHDADLAPSLRIFAFAVPAGALVHSLETSLRGFNRVDLSTLGFDVGFQLPKLIMVALALSAGLGVMGVAGAHIVALLVSSIVLFIFLRALTPSRNDISQPTYKMKRLWKQSLPVYLTSLLRIFNGRLELLFLGVFAITTDVAVYAAALQIGAVGGILIESLITVTMPLISGAHFRGGHEAIRPILRTTTRWCLTATLPYFVAVFLFADQILMIFGESFVEGKEALLLLAAVPLLASVAGVAASVIAMTGNATVNTINSVVYVALTVILDATLIPDHGIHGAAIAVFGATLMLNLLRTIQVRRMFGFWAFDATFLKPIVSAAAAYVVCLVLQPLFTGLNAWVALFAGLGVLGTTYASCLWLLGISNEDRIILDAVREKIPFIS
jgi:O-antigen/teichoic acid export membrane protein